MKPLVVQTEHLDSECAAWLSERCELARCAPDDGAFPGLLARAQGLLVRTYTTVDDAMLAAAPSLKVVARAGVGLDNIDLTACAKRGVTVVHTPDANSDAVVEFVFAAMLDAWRPRMMLDKALDPPTWKSLRAEMTARRQLHGSTLGVYGMGRIGRRVARVGEALGMQVLYHDLLEVPMERRHGARPVTREALLRESEILTVHVDERPANRGLLGVDAFAKCRDDVLFINAARGFIVDAVSLAAFLREHPDATAIIDVHEPEPFGPDYPLLGVPNAVLSPHLAAATATAQRNMSWVVQDLWRVLQGEAPKHPAPVR